MRPFASRRPDSAEAQATRLVSTYADMILRLSYTYLHSTADAEDICQTVLLRAMTQAPAFSSPEHERAWIIRTAINACKDLLKSASRTRVSTLDEPDSPEFMADPTVGVGIDPAEAALRQDDEVLAAVLRLPETYKEVVYLYYYEGLKTDEIARMTDTPPSTVRNRLRDARKLLKEALGGEQG